MSLRRKLTLSLGLLTLIIVVLGAVSMWTLDGVANHGIVELRTHAELSRLADSVRSTVGEIYDAERDFLLSEDEGALSRVTRLSERFREQVEQINAVGSRVMHTEGESIEEQYAEIADAAADYEARFGELVQRVADARASAAQLRAADERLAAKLRDSLDAAVGAVDEMLAGYWKRRLSSAGPERVAGAREQGERLQALMRELMLFRIELDGYLEGRDPSFAKVAVESLTETLVQLDLFRDQAVDSRLKRDLSDARKAVAAFTTLLREGAERLAVDGATTVSVEARIAEEKAELREIGAQIVELAKDLSEDAWRDIDHESEDLIAFSGQAQWILGISVMFGTLVGLLVLFTVPRPIATAIDQLMAGAQMIARGELRTPVQVSSRDELGVLAASFNHMRENLLSLVQRIQRAAVQLSSSINEIQAAATEQAASASEQASAVNQLSSSLNEMSQSAATLVSSSEGAGGSVDEIAGIVNNTNQRSNQIMSSMDAIGNSTRQTSERIQSLNDKMEDINEAVSTISMVADQTTLLSLNASIEANKAGEMGKGFSVVAHEIRRLSDRSIDSAGNISAMVRDIQRATESSALAMNKSSEEIRHGIGLVGESTESFAAIDAAMERIQEQMRMILESVRAQADSSRMVQTTATEMLSSANMVAKAATQTRSVTLELNEMATALSSAVSAFKV
jgi:methyl-accepting chemotaxis protein WspA